MGESLLQGEDPDRNRTRHCVISSEMSSTSIRSWLYSGLDYRMARQLSGEIAWRGSSIGQDFWL